MASVRPFFMPGMPVQEPEGMTPNRFFSQLMESIRAEGGEATPERVIPLLLGLKEPQSSVGADAFGVGLGEVTTPPSRTSELPSAGPTTDRKPNGPAAAAAMRRALAENAATDARMEEFAKRAEDQAMRVANEKSRIANDLPVSAREKMYREFLASQKLDVPDPMRSRTVSDAVLTAAGQWLASQGRDIGGGVAKGAEAWKAGRNRDEDQAEKKLERHHKQFLTAMGFNKEDADSLAAQMKAQSEANLAGITANFAGDPTRMQEIIRQDARALEREKMANAIRAAQISAADRSPSLNTIAGAQWLAKQPEADRAAIASTMHPRNPPGFNKDKAEMAQAEVIRLLGDKAKTPIGQLILRDFGQNVLSDPDAALRKAVEQMGRVGG